VTDRRTDRQTDRQHKRKIPCSAVRASCGKKLKTTLQLFFAPTGVCVGGVLAVSDKSGYFALFCARVLWRSSNLSLNTSSLSRLHPATTLASLTNEQRRWIESIQSRALTMVQSIPVVIKKICCNVESSLAQCRTELCKSFFYKSVPDGNSYLSILFVPFSAPRLRSQTCCTYFTSWKLPKLQGF